MHDGKLCMHDGLHAGIGHVRIKASCACARMMAGSAWMLCMHDGMSDSIDVLEMLCTLNLKQLLLGSMSVCAEQAVLILGS